MHLANLHTCILFLGGVAVTGFKQCIAITFFLIYNSFLSLKYRLRGDIEHIS